MSNETDILKIVDSDGNLNNVIGQNSNIHNIYIDWHNVIQSYSYGLFILITYLYALNIKPFSEIDPNIIAKIKSKDILINKSDDIIHIINEKYIEINKVEIDINLKKLLYEHLQNVISSLKSYHVYNLSPLLSAVNILKVLEINNVLKNVTFLILDKYVDCTEEECANLVIEKLGNILDLFNKNIEYRVELINNIESYYDNIDTQNPVIFTSNLSLFKHIIEHPRLCTIVFPNNNKIISNNNFYYLMSTVIKDIEFIRYNEVFSN